ncbi:MAG: O-methyltransferase family 3 [Armatimonadetes bacterium]|jgi:predicted O-methyltransferase YrrM|nr:O-methyltransferase family 3 [Armatimonadota bacterium]
MAVTYEQIGDYHAKLSDHGDPILLRMEAEARAEQFPIIGPAAGKLCYLMARAIGAKRIFEMGSGYGYSTLWFAKAVRENGGGEVHHTVWSDDLHQRARANVEEAGYSDVVQFHLGEAVQALQQAEGPFDIVFNDIDKDGYPASLPVMKEKLRVGGLILIDNMLWHGRIFDAEDRDESTEGVREFTRRLQADPDFVFQLVPVRDGVIVALRVS